MARKTAHAKNPQKVAAGKARMAQLRERGELAQFQRKGFDALVEKIGMDAVMGKVRAWRLANPSKPERELHGQLRAAGWIDATSAPVGVHAGKPHFRREYTPLSGEYYTVDVALMPDDAVRFAIEVDGNVHRDPLFTNDARAQFERERDERITARGWVIERVACRDLHSDYWAETLVSLLELVQASAEMVADGSMRYDTY